MIAVEEQLELIKRGAVKPPVGAAPGVQIFKNAVDYFR